MDKIICFIDMFRLHSRVYVRNEETEQMSLVGEIPLAELETKIADTCFAAHTNHVMLIGAPTYAEGIVPAIKEYALTKYNNNDLVVEVLL